MRLSDEARATVAVAGEVVLRETTSGASATVAVAPRRAPKLFVASGWATTTPLEASAAQLTLALTVLPTPALNGMFTPTSTVSVAFEATARLVAKRANPPAVVVEAKASPASIRSLPSISRASSTDETSEASPLMAMFSAVTVTPSPAEA